MTDDPVVLSLNVGKAQMVLANGRSVLTGIFKTPASGPVFLRGHQLEGDQQADLRVHGGPYKAVYAYPFEHYRYWQEQLDLHELELGALGENLTVTGWNEETLCIGDQMQIGSAILQVSQPRMPCFKLALRFGRADMVRRFWASNRSGIYFSVVEEGVLQKGDQITRIESGPEAVSVADVVRLFKGEEWSETVRERALRSPLRGSWKQAIRERLTEAPTLS